MTEEKGDLVGAINELFQNANNGKELIASAIGEPLNAEDTLTWEVEVVNSASSAVLTFDRSTFKRAGDPSRVTYKWRGKGANNKWRSLANWEGFSGTVGNNNPCCWGYPGGSTTHVHFDQSTGPEGIDLEGKTWSSIDNGFFVFEENSRSNIMIRALKSLYSYFFHNVR